MKILTNIRFVQTAGIAQTLYSFLDFIKSNKNKTFKFVGVNIMNGKNKKFLTKKDGVVSLISAQVNMPVLSKVMKKAKNIEDIKKAYIDIIEVYKKAIKKEKPDLVLVNGTYYMPWCLYNAAKEMGIPVVLHYHGILTMETKNWPIRQKKMFKTMEKSFDSKNVFYIFPSNIAKKIVENKIYGHKIKNYAVISNCVPYHFLKSKKPILQKNEINIGIVSRWAGIKNMEFCKKLARYNKRKGSKFKINLITDLDKSDQRIKDMGDLIKVHPPMKNKKLANFYRTMGVVISPSHFETYGNVAQEALACGVPAIVNANMGVSETFKKLNLDKWIINFKSVKKVYCQIENIIQESVDKKVIKNITNNYHPKIIFNNIIDTLVSVAINKKIVKEL